MFEPKYLICLEKRSFFPEQVVCLGSQLKSIIKNLGKLVEGCIWFCAEVDAISPIPQKLGIESFRLKKIGNNSSLINLCENIDQFLSGVFVGVREQNQSLQLEDLCVGTEDERFRALDLNGVLIEIRAFDTSYFEIYSESFEVMKKLSKVYNVEIEEFDS